MQLTLEQLLRIMPACGAVKASSYLPGINAAMDEFEINTPQRVAAFIAQIAHESGQLRYVKELASGSAYEGRKDLGNTQPGDGVRFKGRGFIQVTGRTNYTQVAAALGVDCVAHPELLEQPEYVAKVSAWWWKDRGLNALADAGDFLRITKRINGGVNGLADREKYYAIAKKTLGVT